MSGTVFMRVWPALLLACAPAAAQAPAYARTPADTLRYREQIAADVQTSGLAGGRTQLTQDARIAVTWARGDTARAWYEGMEAQAKHGGEHGSGNSRLTMERGETAGGFLLSVDASGRARTLRVPRFPPPLDEEADSVLTAQFLDFFPVLPAAPLRAGLEWTDADSVALTNGWWARETRSRVLRDTVFNGMAAVVVETETRLRMRRNSRLDDEMSFRTALEGTERGRYLFAPAPGLLLRRERTGTLTGTETTLLAGDPPRAARQTREYTATIELLSGGR